MKDREGPAAYRRGQFSIAERDRRYAAIREVMRADGLDALVLPANTGRFEQNMADSRYAGGIGGFGSETLTIFPLEGEPTSYVFNRAEWWKRAQAWIPDVRDGANRWAENALERLGELGIVKGRVGISGYGPLTRSPDGLVAAYQTIALLT